MDPLPAGTYLTIQAGQWTYSGSVRENHVYRQHGNTLIVQRLVDSAVVRVKQAQWQDYGTIMGHPQALDLTVLTADQLVVRDSTMDPDGSLIRVRRYYYSC